MKEKTREEWQTELLPALYEEAELTPEMLQAMARDPELQKFREEVLELRSLHAVELSREIECMQPPPNALLRALQVFEEEEPVSWMQRIRGFLLVPTLALACGILLLVPGSTAPSDWSGAKLDLGIEELATGILDTETAFFPQQEIEDEGSDSRESTHQAYEDLYRDLSLLQGEFKRL